MGRLIKRFLIYISVRIAAFFLLILPVKIAVFLGAKAGILYFYLSAKNRQQVIENLNLAYGRQKTEAEIFEIAKKVFVNLGKNAAEFVSLPKINKSNIDRFIKVYGLEKIDKVLQAKKGAIILSCHLGNWELSAAYFGLKGYPSNAIVRPLRYERFDRLVNSLRVSKGVNVLGRDNSFKKIVSLLKSNQIVGILPDQDIDSIDGVFVNFFNKPAYTPIGLVLLAMASGSPIMPIFCVRQNGAHKLIVEDPIELELTGNKEKDIFVNTQKWTDLVEKYIRQYPEQWVWIHKRWKTQPK